MDHNIKKHIRLLAEKYEHVVNYQANSILLTNSYNEIELYQKDKSQFRIHYNPNLDGKALDVDLPNVYDVLIDLLRRTQAHPYKQKTGNLLTLADWFEGEQGFTKQLSDLIKKESLTPNDCVYFGGNRFELAYYKGIFILTDDLMSQRSNIFESVNLK